jgi:lantibiotic biosynthesis protein
MALPLLAHLNVSLNIMYDIMDQKTKIVQLLHRINHIVSQCERGYNGLLGGNSGLALYHFYLNRVLPESEAAQKGVDTLEYIFDRMNSDDPHLQGHSLAVGAAGFGTMMNNIVQEGIIDFDLNESFQDMDEYLMKNALREAEDGMADVLHQSIGLLHYFSQKTDIAPYLTDLQRIVDAIDQKAIKDELGWRMVSTFGPRSGIHYDFSIAHGLSGTLLVLMHLYEAGLKTDQIQTIVAEGIKFLTYFQRQPDLEALRCNAFPLSVEIENIRPDFPNMLAWCYGDFGPALVIAKASKIWNNPEWASNAVLIANNLGEQILIEPGLVQHDAHFCHGASGVAQCFRALDRVLDLPILKTAYQHWIGHTINIFDEDLAKGTFIGNEIGFLEGMAGVGLVLQSALENGSDRWDKTLLL